MIKPDKSEEARVFYRRDHPNLEKSEAYLNFLSLEFEEQYPYFIMEVEDKRRFSLEQAEFNYRKSTERFNKRRERLKKRRIPRRRTSGNNQQTNTVVANSNNLSS